MIQFLLILLVLSAATPAAFSQFGAGLRYKVGHLSFVPEIRYTRWGDNYSIARKNAAAVLLGLTF